MSSHPYSINSVRDIYTKPFQLYDSIYGKDERNNGDIILERMRNYTYVDFHIDESYRVFATSDIHADLHSFVRLLTSIGLIQVADSKTTLIYKRYRWNPEMRKTVLVICGDLIDGKRDHDVRNTRGSIEVELHMFLYNLRLSAAEHDSYVFITYGNHDYFSFFYSEYYYAYYVDDRSVDFYRKYYRKHFYPQRVRNSIPEKTTAVNESLSNTEDDIPDLDEVFFARNYLLARFYMIGYHFFLKITQYYGDTKLGYLFSHAGFQADQNVLELFEQDPKGGKRNSNEHLNAINVHRVVLNRALVDQARLTQAIQTGQEWPDYIGEILDETGMHQDKRTQRLLDRFQDGFFLTRAFQKDCSQVQSVLDRYGANLMVVGHCPTCSARLFQPENVLSTNCSRALVTPSCENRLVSVDIAMSSAFVATKEFYDVLQIQNGTLTGIKADRKRREERIIGRLEAVGQTREEEIPL